MQSALTASCSPACAPPVWCRPKLTAPRVSPGASSSPVCVRAESSRAASAQSSIDGFTVSVGRRSLLGGAALGAALSLATRPAEALDTSRYVKRKKLDPLETYVAPVMLAKIQLLESVAAAERDAGEARELLRGGAFSGLRDNVRALGEYASDAGAPKTLVPDFFAAIQAYDYPLFIALKEREALDVGATVELGNKAVAALETLLATVPEDVTTKAQVVVDKVRANEGASLAEEGTVDDATLKRLQQLI